MQLLLKNIKQLVTVASNGKPFKRSSEMRDIGVIEDAAVLIEDNKIKWCGKNENFNLPITPETHIFDADGFVALPGFVDAHTHLLFGGSREDEFAMRSEGKTYQEIAEAGGGVLSTMQSTRAATKKELKKTARHRLEQMLRHGTTTVEIKSGYGLDPENETKMLECINELAKEQLTTIVATFLGAHSFPPEYQEKKDEYIELVCENMIPYIQRKGLAKFCDVFCEKRYFTVEQSRKILATARSLGFDLKVHADELAASGGSLLAAEMNAVSADHLEHCTKEAMKALADSNVIGVLLPGVSFFLNHQYAPARALLVAGVPVAIASDFNPGSCMSYSIPLMMTIACTQMKLTPEEAITATTLNAAAALKLSNYIGSIEVGKNADIVLFDIPNYRFLPYHFGENHVARVIKNGVLLEF